MSSNTFQNLSDCEVKARYSKYKSMGMTEDEAFNKVYCEDCTLDNEGDRDDE